MSLLERTDSALLVIDAQDNFYAHHRIDVDRYRLGAVVDRCAWLALAASLLEVPTVVTEEDPEYNGATDSRIKRNLAPGTPILPKKYFSAASNLEILAAIEATGRRSVVVVGLETDICVSHTAIELRDLGYTVAVAHDALFSPGEAHEQGITRLQGEGVAVLSTKGVFYDWIRGVDELDEVIARDARIRTTPGFHL